MRRVLAGLVAILSISLVTAEFSEAAVIPGAKCSKAGTTSVYNGKKYTCIKSGMKLVWNKGVAIAKPAPVTSPSPIPTPSPTPTQTANAQNLRFTDLCEFDPFVPSEWNSYQDFALKPINFGCARPYRFKMVKDSIEKPKSVLTSNSDLNPISMCKLTHGQRDGGQIAFSTAINPQVVLNKRANIQVIPIEFIDFPSSGSVLSENGKYFDYLKNGFYNLSDGQVKIDFRIPTNYFKINKKIASYDTGKRYDRGGGVWNWAYMDMNAMFKDIVDTVDPQIDFSNLDLVFFVVPPSTNNDYISHGFPAPYPQLRTAEGFIPYWYFSPPMSEVDKKSWYGVEPFLHLHEIMHGWNKLDDHYGDGEFGRKDGDSGTGMWGIMSGMLTDFLFWDKWISFMVSDEQVRCANPASTSTHWLHPSSNFGITEKLLVIPIDSKKVLVVESMRAAGFNLKLPLKSEGALVYLVDISKTEHGRGINVLKPDGRSSTLNSNFVLGNAAMKVGESITTNGIKVSVIESGTFGDIIKVEKA